MPIIVINTIILPGLTSVTEIVVLHTYWGGKHVKLDVWDYTNGIKSK